MQKRTKVERRESSISITYTQNDANENGVFSMFSVPFHISIQYNLLVIVPRSMNTKNIFINFCLGKEQLSELEKLAESWYNAQVTNLNTLETNTKNRRQRQKYAIQPMWFDYLMNFLGTTDTLCTHELHTKNKRILRERIAIFCLTSPVLFIDETMSL